MAEVRLTPAAVDDIDRIWLRIAEDNVRAADTFVSNMYDAFDLLAEMPLSARRRPELGSDIRSRPYGNYVIFYESIPNGISVLNVLWGGRDIEAIFKDD